jgi:hypothetical protein
MDHSVWLSRAMNFIVAPFTSKQTRTGRQKSNCVWKEHC